MPENQTVKNAVLGTLVTITAYLIPGFNLAAPLIGGIAAGYSQRTGPRGGLKVGLLMALFLLIPGLIISLILTQFIGLEPFIGLTWMALSILVMSHSMILSIIGGLIGGLIARDRQLEN